MSNSEKEKIKYKQQSPGDPCYHNKIANVHVTGILGKEDGV